MKLRITVENRIYEVEVEALEPEPSTPPRPESRQGAPTPAPVPVSNVAEPASEKEGRSPVAGVVVKLPVAVGQSVQRGDTLVVLEAMKMETNITSPGDGVLKKLMVKQGDTVRSGQPLFEIE